MKLILMSHGPLAAAMLTSAEMIIGKIKGAQTFSLTKEMGPEELKNQVTELLQTIPTDEQIIIGLDLLGGYTGKCCSSVVSRKSTFGSSYGY